MGNPIRVDGLGTLGGRFSSALILEWQRFAPSSTCGVLRVRSLKNSKVQNSLPLSVRSGGFHSWELGNNGLI